MFADLVSEAVAGALASLAAGAGVEDVESQLIDCKEPIGTVTRDGLRIPFSELNKPGKDEAARQLAAEATCLAHGGGGALLVGVRDDRAGLAAFVGTDMDADWLRLRIHELTMPPLTVAIETVAIPNSTSITAPLLVIRVLAAVDIHVVPKGDGTGERPSRWRVGRACVPMTTGDHAAFAKRVRPVDWSSTATSLTISDVDPQALAAARRLQPSMVGADDASVLQRLGVVNGSGHLTNSGALLFAQSSTEIIVFTAHDAPGAPSTVGRISYTPPLLRCLDDLLVRIETLLPLEMLPVAAGLRRQTARSVPMTVAREMLANAIAHRDWRIPQPISVSITSGSVVDVVSPGGFPFGVTAANVLAHPSRPTNPALAHALQILQVAERQGVGVDLMFREMVQLGHQPPEITEIGANVSCRVAGGKANARLVEIFDELPPELQNDVEISLAVHLLQRGGTAAAGDLADLIQRSAVVARSAFDRATDAGLVERMSTGSTSTWRLSRKTRTRLEGTIVAEPRRSSEALIRQIVSYIAANTEPFARIDIDRVLGSSERRSRQLLDELVSRGWIEPATTSRGRSVRYMRGPHWPEALGR
jgi:ATP-dependent DNA helicase RecG